MHARHLSSRIEEPENQLSDTTDESEFRKNDVSERSCAIPTDPHKIQPMDTNEDNSNKKQRTYVCASGVVLNQALCSSSKTKNSYSRVTYISMM